MQDHRAQLVERVRGEARVALEAARKRTSAEIHDYPSPIAGCDAQFNYLLEQRTAIAAELERLAKLDEGRAASEQAKELDAFLGSSSYLDEETRRTLRASLRPAVATIAALEASSHG
jgi:hypothetical protein